MSLSSKLKPRAPMFMSEEDAAKVKAGDMLCPEPWMPCWEPVSHRRETRKGVQLTCWGCGIVGESVPLEGADRFVPGREGRHVASD